MHFFLHYLRPYARRVAGGMTAKFLGTIMELFLPWLLAYTLDEIAPLGDKNRVYLYGGAMLLCSLLAWTGNIFANRAAASVARDCTRTLRHDLFGKITRLTAREIDRFTIPSLISRMTTDTYNIYRMLGMMQRIGIRAPILLIGGIIVTMTLDAALASLLVAILPFMALVVWLISKKGVPLYGVVQKNVDKLTRVIRENLTGIRLIKALSKTEDEKARFAQVNETVATSETKAASVMAVNSPLMQLLLNIGLVLVVAAGAGRVAAGLARARATSSPFFPISPSSSTPCSPSPASSPCIPRRWPPPAGCGKCWTHRRKARPRAALSPPIPPHPISPLKTFLFPIIKNHPMCRASPFRCSVGNGWAFWAPPARANPRW